MSQFEVGESFNDITALDRIDVNKGYEPGNVRWATAQEQAQNRRDYISAHEIEELINEELE